MQARKTIIEPGERAVFLFEGKEYVENKKPNFRIVGPYLSDREK
jgi:hypothetical protein